VYEFWPSDLLTIFRQAGIPRRVPPQYEPGCSMEETALTGKGPQITSPRQGVVYSLRASSIDQERISLSALTDADTQKVHWFMNEEYLGQSQNNKPFFWTPKPGKYQVRAIDDLGRSTVRELRVELVE
jgi:penicillin-binding protein 1C